MDPFHMRLTVNCPDCSIPLMRVAQTTHQDFAICPGCLAAGTYDEVVDDPAGLAADFVLPDGVRDFVSRLHKSCDFRN